WSIDNDSLTTVINEWIEFESIATDLEGRRLIASSRDGRLLVLDGHLFGSRREIRVPWRDGCRRLALSPDGKWLAAGSLSYDGIVLWDLDRVPDMRPGSQALSADIIDIAVSPDETGFLAVRRDGTFESWSLHDDGFDRLEFKEGNGDYAYKH